MQLQLCKQEFLSCFNRLEPFLDEAEGALAHSILDGGAKHNLTSSSIVCVIDDISISVKFMMSLQKGSIIVKDLMAAFIKLCSRRDELVRDAYLINEKKAGYTPRRPYGYVSPYVADVLFSTELDDDIVLNDSSIQILALTGNISGCHRTVIPFYWASKSE